MNINFLEKHKKVSAFLLGALSVSAMPPVYFFPILIVCFSSFLYLLEKTENKKQGFWLGYLFGFGFFSFGFSWIGNAVLIEPEQTGWLFPIIFLASGAYFGLFAAFPAMLAGRGKNIVLNIVSFAAWWTIFEWIRGFLFTGFPWNPIGSALTFSPMFIQSASVFGVYGLSFLTVLFCCLPVAIFKGKKSAIISFGSMCLIFVSLLVFGFVRLPSETKLTNTKVRLVQPAIPQGLKWQREQMENNFLQYIEMSAEGGQDDVDFVIWGETASPFNPRFHYEYMDDYKKAVPQNGYLVFGALDYEYSFGKKFLKNAMLVMDKDGNIVDVYDKMHLVPFGEYIPFRKYIPETVRPLTQIISDLKEGTEHNVINLSDKPSFGGLICYEVIFPSKVTDKDNRPEWIAVLTNDGWYGISMGPYQHLAAAQMRAVEEGIPIVRSANSGISAVIDANGRINVKIDLAKKGVADAYIPTSQPSTIYAKCGNYPILMFCFLIVIMCAFISVKAHKK